MTPEETAELIRLNLGLGEPYKSGERVSASVFDRRRVAICPACGDNPCDFFEYKGTVVVDGFCSDTCSDHSRREQQQAARQAERELRKGGFHVS